MSAPSAPAPPDYASAAAQTSAGNALQARIAQYGSMTNQVTPYGAVNYAPNIAKYSNAKGQDLSVAEYDKLKGNKKTAGQVKGYTPLNQWTQTVGLSPSQQIAFDQNNRINAQLGNIAEGGTQYVQSALANPLQGQQYSGNISPTADQMVRNVNAPTLQGSYDDNANQIQTQSGANQYASGDAPNNANQIQTQSGANQYASGDAPNNANQIQTQSGANQQASGYVQDPNLLNQQVQNALYQNSTQYLDPQFQQSNAQLANRLANQGITQGSEAYNNAMLNAGNQQQQAYESARNQAVSGGIGAAQGMFGMNLNQAQLGNSAAAQNNQMMLANQQAANQALGQQFGQGVTSQQLGNSAAAQNNQMMLANQQAANQALGQQFGQGVTNQQLGNSAAAQNNQMMLANQQAANQALGQQNTQRMGAADFANRAAQAQYGMGTQNAALQNQAAQQAYQQALSSGQFQNQTAGLNFAQNQALQQNPLNMLNAVRTGQQLQTAQMPQVGQSNPAALQAVTGPDMLGAAQAQGQYSMNTYNQQMAAYNAMMSGATSSAGTAAGAGAGMYSDRRLKKNIVRIGTHALGIGLYTWDYIWGQPFTGVMADEVEKVMPEAVGTHPSGFKWVNYKMLGLV